MATNNRSRVEEARRKWQKEQRDFQLDCDHRSNKGPQIEPLANMPNTLSIKDRSKYPADAVICKDCRDIFGMYEVSDDDYFMAMYAIRSMINQIKVFDDLKPEDRHKLSEFLGLLDEFDLNIRPYYKNLIKQLAGKGKKNNNNGVRPKGKLGVGSNQIAIR